MSSNVASDAKIAPDAAAAPAVLVARADASGRRALVPWAIGAIALIVLPFVVMLCVAAAAYAVRHLARRAPVALAAAAGVAVVAATLELTGAATWPHRAERVELGELAAVEGLCLQLGEDDVVLAVDSRAANEWPQVVRGQCGRAALSTRTCSDGRSSDQSR